MTWVRTELSKPNHHVVVLRRPIMQHKNVQRSVFAGTIVLDPFSPSRRAAILTCDARHHPHVVAWQARSGHDRDRTRSNRRLAFGLRGTDDGGFQPVGDGLGHSADGGQLGQIRQHYRGGAGVCSAGSAAANGNGEKRIPDSGTRTGCTFSIALVLQEFLEGGAIFLPAVCQNRTAKTVDSWT